MPNKRKGDVAAGIQKLTTALAHCRATGDHDLTSGMCRMMKESLNEFRRSAGGSTPPRVAAAK